MAQYHDNTYALSNLIMTPPIQGDAKDAQRIYDEMLTLMKDPLVLACYGSPINEESRLYACPPLAQAVRQGNLPAAKAILTVMRDHAEAILKQLDQERRLDEECPLKHPFYCFDKNAGTGSELPHHYLIQTNNPQMVALLHEYGYDLNACLPGKPGGSFYELLVNKFCKGFNLSPNHMITAETNILLHEAIKAGVDMRAHRYAYELDEHIGLGQYAFRKICNRGVDDSESTIYILKLMMGHGIDFRDVLAGPVPPNFVNNENEIEWKTLRGYAHTAATSYLHVSDPNRRAHYAHVTCAAGNFHMLLNLCHQEDKKNGISKEVPELLSHLDAFWMHEYGNVIEATAGRMVALKTEASKTALARYAAGSTMGGPGV